MSLKDKEIVNLKDEVKSLRENITNLEVKNDKLKRETEKNFKT
jgi:FtsZ-binding cell division protein ZapB